MQTLSSKERDAETNNDYFGARYYSNRFGRWLSADRCAVPVAVPYANLTNPQSLNLYSMVGDDPESFADLDGHTCFQVGAGGLCNAGGNEPAAQQQQQSPDAQTAQQSPYQKWQEQQNQPVTDDQKLQALSQAGAIAEPGVKAAMVVGAVEAAPIAALAAVEAAPAVVGAVRTAAATADTASLSRMFVPQLLRAQLDKPSRMLPTKLERPFPVQSTLQ